MCMGIPGFTWVFISMRGFALVCMGGNGCAQMCINVHGVAWTCIDEHGWVCNAHSAMSLWVVKPFIKGM